MEHNLYMLLAFFEKKSAIREFSQKTHGEIKTFLSLQRIEKVVEKV